MIEDFHDMLKKKNQTFEEKKKIFFSCPQNQQDVIVEYGIDLIQNYRYKLQNDYFLVLKNLFFASVDLKINQLQTNCFRVLQNQFGTDNKILQKMFGVTKESQKNFEFLNQFHDQILKENSLNNNVKKKKISIQRSKGDQFVQDLNKYLMNNLNDQEAWQELADYYLEQMDYTKAAYCYEQIILLNQNPHFITTLAEIYYSAGQFQQSQNYYNMVLCKYPKSVRALWGLHQTLNKLKDKQHLGLVQQCLKKQYKTIELPF